MKILSLVSAVLLIGITAEASADRLRSGDISVEVVNAHGWELPTYSVRTANRRLLQKSYVEAGRGQQYGIRVTNHTPERLGFVIAVDGRNIISGKRSNLSSGERKYVLGPYQTATYRGWRSSRNRINEFYFTDENNSYSAAFGDYSAMGVIAVATFREQYRYEQESYHYESRKSAPKSRSGSSDAYKSAPGTGYGDERYSRSRKVNFDSERRAAMTYLIKYEWRGTLCDMGVARCQAKRNRFWNNSRRHADRGYAPPPPAYRAYRQYR